MMNKSEILTAMRAAGQSEAQTFRRKIINENLSGTEIIAEEHKIPAYIPTKDYSGCAAGTAVRDDEQVWQLIQPHNAANYQGRPSTLRALWSLCHTQDPARAKPWVDACGTSGMYMTGECYLEADGETVYRAKQDNLVHDADEQPEAWEAVTV